MPCMNWLRGIANERLDKQIQLYNIQELKDWYKRLVRINKSHGASSVVVCADTVLMNFIKAPTGTVPNPFDLALRLKAVRVSLDDEFPELPSPVSIRSFAPSVSSQDLPVPFSQVVKGAASVSPREEVAGPSSAPQPKTVASEKTAALGDDLPLGESSSLGVDITENPLVKAITAMINVKFGAFEHALGSLVEKVASGEKEIASLRKQASLVRVEAEERDSSPPRQSIVSGKRKQEASPPFSPKKRGLEFATDQRKAIRRGKLDNVLRTPGKSEAARVKPHASSMTMNDNLNAIEVVSGEMDDLDDDNADAESTDSNVSDNIVNLANNDNSVFVGDGYNVKASSNIDFESNIVVDDDVDMYVSVNPNDILDEHEIVVEYDDANVDGDNVSASPNTIRNVNARCTGKGSYYARSPKVIIEELNPENDLELERTMSAASFVDKEKGSNPNSLQQKNTAMKDKRPLDTSYTGRQISWGKSASAKVTGKVHSSIPSKLSGYEFDVLQYNMKDYIADDHISFLSSVFYDPYNAFPHANTPSLITTAFFPISMTPTTRETLECVTHKYKELGKRLNKRAASMVISGQVEEVSAVSPYGDTAVVTGIPCAQVATVMKTDNIIENVPQPSTVSLPLTSHDTAVNPSHTTPEETTAQGERAVAVGITTTTELHNRASSGSFLPVSSTTGSSNKPSHITIEQEYVPASYSLVQEDAPDPNDPAAMEIDEDDPSGTGEVDLLADPACWRPFPCGSQILRKDGKTIGFRTKSGLDFGPDRIEIRPDASGQQWVFRFITHDYSVPVDRLVTRRVQKSRFRRDLDEYLMSIDESLRSRCSNDSTFKDLPGARYAMEIMIPHGSILEQDEFKDREKLWNSLVTAKNVTWPRISSFHIKLRNESLKDLHRVLQAPKLRLQVAQTQLMFDVNLITEKAVKNDFEARSDLAFVVGYAAQLSLIAADQTETVKFLPESEVATHLTKIGSALSAMSNSLDTMLFGTLRRFYEARLEARQEAFRGFEQNVRVMELMKSSPFCRLLFPTSVVKETLQAMRNSPLGVNAFFRKNRKFVPSSNLPFRITPKIPVKARPKKAPVKRQVVLHPRWSKSSQPRSSGYKSDSGKSPAKSSTPFRGRKGGPYKGRGRGGTK